MQGAMPGNAFEVIVGAQKHQIVPNAQLGQQRINRAYLDTCVGARLNLTICAR